MVRLTDTDVENGWKIVWKFGGFRVRKTQVGGTQYIASILDSAPVVANLRSYGVIVYEKWRLRQTILVAQRIVARGFNDRIPDAQAFVDEAAKAYVTLGRVSPVTTIEGSRAGAPPIKAGTSASSKSVILSILCCCINPAASGKYC